MTRKFRCVCLVFETNILFCSNPKIAPQFLQDSMNPNFSPLGTPDIPRSSNTAAPGTFFASRSPPLHLPGHCLRSNRVKNFGAFFIYIPGKTNITCPLFKGTISIGFIHLNQPSCKSGDMLVFRGVVLL